jgi:hypothetical protein
MERRRVRQIKTWHGRFLKTPKYERLCKHEFYSWFGHGKIIFAYNLRELKIMMG